MTCRSRARPYWGDYLKPTRRKLLWDRGGVSEVIGTILTLSITVVLFSGIIAMVNGFPAPGDNVYTDFTATIEPINDWAGGAFIHITNTGGEQMTDLWTIIVVTIDDFTYTLSTKGTLPVTGPYGLGQEVAGHRGDDDFDNDWDTGERWTLERNETQISRASDVSVMILDQEKNVLVWMGQIQGNRNEFGPIISNIRTDSDIGSLRSDPIQFGGEFYIYAEVYDPDGDLNVISVNADLSSILPSQNNILMTDADGDGIFIGGPITGPNTGTVPIGYHIAIVRASDIAGTQSSGSARIAVGVDLGDQPNLRIQATDISINPESPINGQTVSIAVTVKNYGGLCRANITLYDIVGISNKTIGMKNFTISQGPSQITITIPWTSKPGGVHNISAWTEPLSVRDATPEDNWNYTNITVLPKILLVDDDNHPADLSERDTVSYMKGALESADFGYDLYTVGPDKDGPGYLVGQKKMEDYDVVIWMTGYEKVKTLTDNDRTNITSYLNGDPKGGSLWMIGQYLYNDPGIPAAFFKDILRTSGSVPDAAGPTNPLVGKADNPVSFQWWNVTYIPVVTRVPGEAGSWHIAPDTSVGAELTFIENATSTYGDAINYENIVKHSRLVFFPWEFSRIANTGDQTQVAYRVLTWLGNITRRSGNDLAVSEQTMSSNFVYFNQVVRVDAVIRNNGRDNLTTQIGLFLDSGNELVAPLIIRTIPGGGSSITVSENWTATKLGVHVLKWKVDPNTYITETNEGNNEVPSYITSGEVFVEFRILIVDDDFSSNNNNGTLSNDTALFTDSLNRLGYTYESPNGPNTTYVVMGDVDGPSIDILKNYSSVIWITGESADGLTASDSYNLATYLSNNQGMLWLSGDNLGSNMSATNLSKDMGISSITNSSLAGTLRGVDGSPISHGMNISIAANPNADILTPAANASGVFYQSLVINTYCAVMKDGGSYKGFTSAFNMSTLNGSQAGYISGNNATDELVYMVLHWMSKPDTRSEVRITERDYDVSNWHPQIGGAYIVRATVHNVGANVVNVLVRFMDGSTQIGAQSVSISPDGQTSAEIIWRPLFAGQRTINILVDPINEVDEIFQWFNNNYSFSIYVYFFWDDMESGASKWNHASTLISINGEGPLDFLTASYTTVNTDVMGSWDWNRTDVENSTAQSHSYPTSFYMEETDGTIVTPVTLDVVLVFDTSNSMGGGVLYPNRPIDLTKKAALGLVQNLSDESRVAIWQTASNVDKRETLRYTLLDAAGRALIGSIEYLGATGSPSNELDPAGWTTLWQTVGEAVAYSDAYSIQTNVVIALTDGQDFQGADTSIANPPANADYAKVEMGSAVTQSNQPPGYSPWTAWGLTGTFPSHWGKYFGHPTTEGYWYLQDFNTDDYARGLLHAPMPVYTVGLSLETATTPSDISNPKFQYSGTLPLSKIQSNVDVYNGAQGNESGTPEYNMWRIANTSHAKYYYASSPDDLIGIFTSLSEDIGSGFNQTRSATPAPETRAANMNKQAVSPVVDLSEYQSASFSFWHKYNMLSGGNGGIIGVEVWEPAPGSWKFLYIIPPGAYTGGIYYGYSIYDDFGNPIKWCFNGISGRNTFSWDYTNVNILPFIEEQGRRNHSDPNYYKGSVRLAMKYVQFGGGTGEGWYIDDVKLDVSRADANPILTSTKDIWLLNNTIGHKSNSCWSNIDPITKEVRTGIDNSLITNPIDLTNAKNAYLSAYFKFNLNQNSGTPPDGFRVEISSDGGATWKTLNLGVRSSWGVSGTGNDMDDGKIDSKTYTGLTDSGNASLDGYWVSASSLTRLNIDISSWSGQQVILRFRMVTNNLPAITYPHNDNAYFGSDPGFGGFYVDDVNVYGQTIFG